jgi:hypothetical protein
MAQPARHAILSETATFDAKTGALRIVIETPKGSRNKYDYDPRAIAWNWRPCSQKGCGSRMTSVSSLRRSAMTAIRSTFWC